MDPFEYKKRKYPVSSEDVLSAWRHQIRWQIYLPLGLVLLLLASLIAVLWLSQVGDESVWADIALVFLFALAIVLGLVGLTILVVGVIGVIYLIRVIPPPLDQTREAAYDAQAAVEEASKAATKPVIAPQAASHAAKAGIRYLAGIFKG